MIEVPIPLLVLSDYVINYCKLMKQCVAILSQQVLYMVRRGHKICKIRD